MITSEQAAWAKAEAERFSMGLDYTNRNDAPSGFEAGILHVLSLLESETAVEASALSIHGKVWGPSGYMGSQWEARSPRVQEKYRDEARAALAAAVGAITQGGSKS